MANGYSNVVELTFMGATRHTFNSPKEQRMNREYYGIFIYKVKWNGFFRSVIVHVFNVDNAHDAFISFGFCVRTRSRFIADT